MKKYFRHIIKPKWYILLIGMFFYMVQCFSIIQLCAQFGGGYYTIAPLQLFVGYVNVMVYLMMQKDIQYKSFVVFVALSLTIGIASAYLIFPNLYTSVPGVNGVFYGIIMKLILSMVCYVIIGAIKNIFFIGKRV